jgi:hypothetical protein
MDVKKYLLFFAALLFSGLVEADTSRQPLQIAPRTQLFPVLTTAIGSFDVEYPFIRVNFDKLTIRNASKDFQHILGLRVGIAKTKIGTSWDVDRWSDYFVSNRELLVDRTIELSGLSTYVPIDGLTTLQGFWLVVATEVAGSPSTGKSSSASYSHSPEGIFKSTLLTNPLINSSPVPTLPRKTFQFDQ